MVYTVTSDSATKISESSGTIQNHSRDWDIEISNSADFTDKILLYPRQNYSFSNMDVYLRCAEQGRFAEVFVVPFKVEKEGGDVSSVVDTTALKSVTLDGNTFNFYTSSDTAQAAAYSIDIPAEQFIDQAATNFVPNFYFSAILYPNAIDPNLNGKPVFVLGVKSKSNDGLSNTIKYSFIDVSKLVDTYVASDTSVTVSDYKLKVNISPDAGNFLRLKSNGLYADGVTDTATSSTFGLTKLYNGTGTNTDGTITQAAITTEINNKASTDTATTSSNGLMSAADKAKLISIEDSAQVNAIETVKVNGTALTPASKAVNIDLTNYVTKDGSKVLSSNDFTTTEKNKLSGIAENANNYVLPTASNSTLGGVKIGNNISNSNGTISISKDNVTNALGYTPPTTNTTYSIGNTSTAGLTKLYTATGTATDGTMTQNAIKSALDGKLDSTAKANSATTADKLSTARSLKVSLSSTSAPTFDGSANVTTIGVGGILPTAYGGTGNANGTVSGAAQLNTARNIVTNLASTVPAGFNGTASVSAGVTGILPVTNGGTGVSNLDNITVGGANRDGAGNVISDTYVTKAEFKHKVDALRLGYRIKKTEADPYERVEYLYDAVGMTPAHMDFDNGVFDYGSWKDVWFVADNKPLMLKSNGTVDYYLDPNDYTKKADGTASDVANENYDGNAMAQFPLCWVYRYEDDDYLYEIVSNVQYDENYKAYAHTDANGIIKDYFYHALFVSSGSTDKLRSLCNKSRATSLSHQEAINGAGANGSNWYITSWAQFQLFRTLITLLGKSTDSQSVFGNGVIGFSSMPSIKTGTLNNKGQFFGYNTTDQQVKAFHVESIWGEIYKKMVGFVKYNGSRAEFYVKMTPENGGYPSSDILDGFTKILEGPFSTSGLIKEGQCNEYGFLPTKFDASETTYFCDRFVNINNNSSDTIYYALWGSSYDSGNHAGIHYLDVYETFNLKLNNRSCFIAYV